MNPRVVAGYFARRLPRGRGHVGKWLNEHPGDHELSFRDTTGHLRVIDLRDELEARWFAGERNVGLPPEILVRVRPGDLVIDAGANIGVITGQLANKVGSDGRVHAFEPLPRNISRLERLGNDNGLTQVIVHPVALGAAAGSAELRLSGVGGGAYASFTATWINEGRLEVEVRTIDEELQGLAPSFIKIDVEGFEYQVLQGASETLAEHKPLLFLEVNHAILKDAGSSGAEFLQLVEEQFDYIVSPVHRHLVATAHAGMATILMQHRKQ